MAKVSVVIPVYNVEKYLRECLDSVQNQTLRDIEIICVDDGSADMSGMILDEYACKDNRFRIIHKKNEGYGKAMNVGMSLAAAPYIGIVESDDRIDSHMYESLLDAIEKTNADVVKSDFYEFYDNGEGGYIEEYAPLITSKETQELYGKLLQAGTHKEVFLFRKYTWDGLYSRAFLQREHIVYNETPGASFQDNGFWFQTMVKAKNIYFMKQAFYHYRIDNPGASMRSEGKVFSVCDEYDFVHDILDEMGECGKNFYGCANFVRMRACVYQLNRVADEYKEVLAQRIKDDFLVALSLGEVDADLYSDAWKRIVFEIISNPKAFVEKERMRRNKVERVISDYETIILYGAGKLGCRAQRLLKEGRDNTKIKYFAVTETEGNPKEVFGIPVKAISDLRKYRDQALVIISVGKTYAQEVENILVKEKFTNYVFLNDIM